MSFAWISFVFFAPILLSRPGFANRGCPCRVHFTRSLDESFLHQLQTHLRLPVRSGQFSLLDENGLVLYLDPAREETLEKKFASVLRGKTRVPADARWLHEYEGVPTGARVFLHPDAAAVEDFSGPDDAQAGAMRAGDAFLHNFARNASVAKVQRNVEWASKGFVSFSFPQKPGGNAAQLYESLASALAAQPGVMWVEPRVPVLASNLWQGQTVQGAKTADGQGRSREAANACKGTGACSPFWAAGYRGAGQIVGVSDTGAAATCMLRDPAGKAVPTCTNSFSCPDNGHATFRSYWSGQGGDFFDADGHGTHVTGTVSGGTGQEEFSGVAPLARVAFVDVHSGAAGGFLSIPEPYDSALFAHTFRMGARVHSGSWGADDKRYSADDMWVDAFSWENREFLAIFAAGNNGERGSDTILSPGMAKNALTVGAVMNGFAAWQLAGQSGGGVPSLSRSQWNSSWTAPFSSRGGAAARAAWPKPDVMAPGGQYVWSSSSSCEDGQETVEGMAGTSMGTPAVTGAAAIASEWFERNLAIVPRGSLLRATLVAASEPGAGLWPGRAFAEPGSVVRGGKYEPYGQMYVEGHGTVRLSGALPLATAPVPVAMCALSNENAAAQMTRQGQRNVHCLTFPAAALGDEVFTVAMSWTDPPQSVAAGDGRASILNDLDVSATVFGVGGHGGDPDAAWEEEYKFPNGLSVRDSASTNERIRVRLPRGSLGAEVRISAARIQFSPQTYSLLSTVQGMGGVFSAGGGARECVVNERPNSAGSCVLCATGVVSGKGTCENEGGGTTRTETRAVTSVPTGAPATPVPTPARETPRQTTRPTAQPTFRPTAQPTNRPSVPEQPAPTPFPTFFIDQFPEAPPETQEPTPQPAPLFTQTTGQATPTPPVATQPPNVTPQPTAPVSASKACKISAPFLRSRTALTLLSFLVIHSFP